MIPSRVLCPPELRPELELMLQELADFGLEVTLHPAPVQMHGMHFVRAVWCHNPDWYRDLCATYQRRRRDRAARYTDPLFKRSDVVTTLRQLLAGGSRRYLAGPLLDIARDRTVVPMEPWTIVLPIAMQEAVNA